MNEWMDKLNVFHRIRTCYFWIAKVSLYLDSLFLIRVLHILSEANTFICSEIAISYSRFISKYTYIYLFFFFNNLKEA